MPLGLCELLLKHPMSEIIVIIGDNEVAPRLVDGVRRLEYRGYDSAGIATLLGRVRFTLSHSCDPQSS